MTWTSIRDFLQIPSALTGKNINIAVVDAGFPDHPDITSNDRRQTYLIQTSETHPEPVLFYSNSGPWNKRLHGLLTASAAAGSGALSSAKYTGAAPEANLYLIETGTFISLEDIETKFSAALIWLFNNWRTYHIRGVVLTVGSTRNETGQLPWQVDPINALCEKLVSEGLLVVVASGNTVELTCNGPASSPSVLSVGGVIIPEDTEIQQTLPYHGCRGTTFDGKWIPDILAPAENLVLPMPFQSSEEFNKHFTASIDNLPEGYARTEGTSFSGPIILGCAACIWQANPDWTANQVRSAIVQSAVKISMTKTAI